MSNYGQTTFFTPKDTLPITDPNKTIFGAAYDVEFANIATAISTKLDSTFVNPSLVSLNVTANGLPVNGIYLPAANTLGFAVNTTFAASIAPTGTIWGAATGGLQGAGTINATGLFVNGAAVLTSAGSGATVTGTGAAALSAAAIAVGQTYIVWVSTPRNITTNAVPAIDPTVQMTAIPAGTYNFALMGSFSGGASGAVPGFIAGVNNSGGTFSNVSIYTSAASGLGQSLIFGANLTGGQSLTAGNNAGLCYFTGSFKCTVAGAVALFWSQASSSGTATTLNAGTWLSITRVL